MPEDQRGGTPFQCKSCSDAESYAFQKIYKVRKAHEYNAILNNRTKVSIGPLSANMIRNTHGVPRLGMSISKKYIKKAVKRNLIKRIIRESFRYNRHKFPNIDIIVMYKNDDLRYIVHLHKNLKNLWKKIIKFYS